MKKLLLPFVLLLLLVPLFARQVNSVTEAQNIRNSLNNPDGTAGYIQQQYLSGDNSGGGSGTTGGAGGIGTNNPTGTGGGVTINEIAASNPNQIDDGRDLLQAEQDLKAQREKDIISFCRTVLLVYLAAIVVINVLKFTNPVLELVFVAALAATLLTMIGIGFAKIFHNYPDGINPSGGVKTVCSVLLGSILAADILGGITGSGIVWLTGMLVAGFAFIKSGKIAKGLAKEVVNPSSLNSSGKQETADDIMKRANQYKGGRQ